MSVDELDHNPFYRALQTTYKSKLEEAQEKCWLICVPCASSLHGIKITAKFVDAHILRPSPYFKSHFVCATDELNKTVEWDGVTLRTTSGFTSQVTTKVLSEEQAYNEAFQPYKIMVIDRPFVGDTTKCESQASHPGSSEGEAKHSLWTYKECITFLQSVPCHAAVLEKLDKKLQSFCSSYMVLPGYLYDTSQKLRDVISWAVESLRNAHTPRLRSGDQMLEQIAWATESYVLGAVHQKVFGAVKELCREKDLYLAERLRQMDGLGLGPDRLGIREAFCCPLPRAVVELASLDAKMTPLEKLLCMRSTLEIMSEEIHESQSDKGARLKYSPEELYLTSDDLIPLLVCVIVHAKLPHIESNLYYIQNFSHHVPDKDMLGYTLVTFQAAKEFIKTYDTFDLRPSSTKLKKEISPVELMQVTAKMQLSEKEGNAELRSRPIDRQLRQVTRLIEASTRDFREREVEELKSSYQMAEDGNRRSSLGDLLSGLQSPLGVSYGKLDSPQ